MKVPLAYHNFVPLVYVMLFIRPFISRISASAIDAASATRTSPEIKEEKEMSVV